ncbi:MAG: protoporphyrinogen oxidase, partial [Candidatus Limnocylindrales bacterium]
GISGLAAARALALHGVPVTVAEGGPRLGGKISTERSDGFVIEGGPDSFLVTRPAAVRLARDLGLGDELVGTRDPRAVFIRHRGRLVPMPAGLGFVLPTRALPFAMSPLFSWPEKLRMAKDIAWPRMLGPDDEAVGTFLRRRLGSPLVDRLAGPLVGGVYGTPIDELSLDAVVPQLRTAEADHRSLLFAGLADGRKMRRAMAARPAGAASLGAFASLRGGMDGLTGALAASLGPLGVDVRTVCGVRTLTRAGSGVAARFADGSLVPFDAAVIATPAPVAAVLLDGELPAASLALDAIPHGTSILVTLAYPRERVEHPLVGHGYLVPPTEGGAIAACTWTSEKWPDRAPDGTVLLRMFVRDEGAWTSLPDDALVAAARADAELTLGITGEPLLVRVVRYAGSMPRYTVGHLRRVAAIDAVMAEWRAVILAGSSYRGVGLPDCIAGGETAAGRALASLGAVSVATIPELAALPA